MSARLLGIVLSSALGCGAVRPEPPKSESPRASAVALPIASSTAQPIAAATASAGSTVSAEAPLAVEAVQVLSVPVTAIAVGDGTRVAALADPPYVGDARGFHALALPAALRPQVGEVDHTGIFFGRDNEPRVMGWRQTAQGQTSIYWRHLPNAWRDGRVEIGQLGGTTRGGLWGVLGAADPELVCRAGALCIIKRQSGWSTVPAGSTERIVTLQDGVLWGLDSSGISSIDPHGWSEAIPASPCADPRALWATVGEAWVGAELQLCHYLNGKWQVVASPIGEVRSFWGARRDSIWIAGSAGAAHFDGRRLRPLALPGPWSAVRGRSDSEVWFGGERGLFRVRTAN